MVVPVMPDFKYMTPPTVPERLTKLETNYENIQTEVREANQKLDSLLALRNKGLGAFWLASFLTGTGIIGVFEFIRGHFH